MAKSNKIKAVQCPTCGADLSQLHYRYCNECSEWGVEVTRDKRQVTGDFTVVDWFSSRSSAGLIFEDADGNRYPLYMSDVFTLLDGLQYGNRTLEETKKGSAYGWALITKEGE